MTFVAREFEKKLRELHRAELSRSPELKREYKRQRKSQNVARSRIGRHLFMPLFWTAVFFAMVQRTADLKWAAGVVALWTVGTALKWGHQWFHQFYASEDLVVLNLLPLNDRQIFQFQLRRYAGSAGWVFWELLLVYAALAMLPAESRPPWFAFPIAAIAQGVLVIALALHSASFLHMLPLGTLAGLFRLNAIVLLVVGLQGTGFVQALVRATEWFLPTGWINYILTRAGDDWAIFALAIPLIAIVYLARFSFDRLRNFYSLEGFEIIPGPAEMTGADHGEVSAEAFSSRAGPTEIEDRITARHFLGGVNWNLRGGIEKLVGRMLSSRERVITEFLVAQEPGWTRSLKWSLWVWLFVTVVVLSFGSYGTIVFFGAYVLGAATLLGAEWRGMRQSAAGGMFLPAYSLYPIGFNEMAKIFLKVNFLRLCAVTPLVTSFAAVAAFKLGHSPLHGAVVGLKVMGMLLCLQPLLVLLPISSTTNDTSRMLPLWIFAFLPILLVIIACALGIFLSDTGLGVLTSFLVMLLLTTLLFFLYRKAYRSGRFDLLNLRSRGESS